MQIIYVYAKHLSIYKQERLYKYLHKYLQMYEFTLHKIRWSAENTQKQYQKKNYFF